jgi:hypothetical protein
MAPRVAEILARELGRDPKWQKSQLESFDQVAGGYLVRT